jgi:hypothetical protein
LGRRDAPTRRDTAAATEAAVSTDRILALLERDPLVARGGRLGSVSLDAFPGRPHG